MARVHAFAIFTCAALSVANVSCSGVSDGASGNDRAQAVPVKDQERAAGEYIVTLRHGANEASVRQLFSAFDVERFTKIGGQQWLLKVRKDPGAAAMQSKAAESQAIETIQPNFTYRQQR